MLAPIPEPLHWSPTLLPFFPSSCGWLPPKTWPVPQQTLSHIRLPPLRSLTFTTAVPVREQPCSSPNVCAAPHRATFHELVADAATAAVVVSQFLALLELYRKRAVEFSQDEALGELAVTWTAGDTDVDVDVEIDEYQGEVSPELPQDPEPQGDRAPAVTLPTP